MSFLRAEEQGAKFWCLHCLSYIVAFSNLKNIYAISNQILKLMQLHWVPFRLPNVV